MEKIGPLSRSPGAFSLFLFFLCAAPAVHGEPITYTFTIHPDPTVDPTLTVGVGVGLGTSTFNDIFRYSATLTFSGDTGNVVPWCISNYPTIANNSPACFEPYNGITGYENLIGTAWVTVTDLTTGKDVAKGTFLQSDGIFVSVDLTNGGVGFGSFGAPPFSPSFPGHPVFPLGVTFERTVSVPASLPLNSYNLQQDISFTQIWSATLSCYTFPGGCNTPPPPPLATTAGDLVFYWADCCYAVTFTSTLGSIVNRHHHHHDD